MEKMIIAGTTIEDSLKAKLMNNCQLYYTVGIHPCRADTFN